MELRRLLIRQDQRKPIRTRASCSAMLSVEEEQQVVGCFFDRVVAQETLCNSVEQFRLFFRRCSPRPNRAFEVATLENHQKFTCLIQFHLNIYITPLNKKTYQKCCLN